MAVTFSGHQQMEFMPLLDEPVAFAFGNKSPSLLFLTADLLLQAWINVSNDVGILQTHSLQ
jgi:hypothetical protein